MFKSFQEEQTIREIEEFLSSSYEESQAATRWLSKQSQDLQLLATKESSMFYLTIKKNNSDISKAMLHLVATLRTAHKISETYKKAHRKNAEFESTDIILLDALEGNLFLIKRRVSKKREFLQRKFLQIKKWRDIGASYQAIASRLITLVTISAKLLL
jgi:hypothetical protein